MANPLVAIVIGSDSDFPVMREAEEALKEFEIPYEVRILSAHRTPRQTAEFAEGAEGRGIEVIIAGAGGAAHLAGAIASLTILPVIGVPIDSSPLRGVDSLYSIVQMPGGVPVATMAVGKAGARNAGIFAAQILAAKDPKIREKLREYKRNLAEKVVAKDASLREG
ncbi:MAG: 5-(carboxyamino)imidazole ribonucleotide mutase [bacterium]